MAQVINTNVASLFAGAALTKSAHNLQVAQARLASGLRINSAADDPTGLVTATGYDATIRGTNIAIRNANDAVSKSQTLDGYASQIVENLQRLHDIFVQTNNTSTTESVALLAENNRIATLANAATIAAAVTVDGAGGTVTAGGVTLTALAGSTAATVLTDITNMNTSRAKFGADVVQFSSAVNTMQSASVNLSAAYSRIMDTDYAVETTSMTRNNILQQAGMAALAQANQTPNNVMSLLR